MLNNTCDTSLVWREKFTTKRLNVSSLLLGLTSDTHTKGRRKPLNSCWFWSPSHTRLPGSACQTVRTKVDKMNPTTTATHAVKRARPKRFTSTFRLESHYLKFVFWAALISICLINKKTIKITMCHVKGVTSRDKPAEDYHRTLQSHSDLFSVPASFSALFWSTNSALIDLIYSRRQLFAVEKLAV